MSPKEQYSKMDKEELSEDEKMWMETCKDIDEQNKLEMHFVKITGWKPDNANKHPDN